MKRQPDQGLIAANRFAVSRWALALAVTGVLGTAAWLYSSCQHDPRVAYLPAQAAGDWIVYPRAPWLRFFPAAEFDTTFERSFEISQVPALATLELVAFRRCELLVNGKLVFDTGPGEVDWKAPRQLDIAKALRPGRNHLLAVITSRGSHPALCLSLQLPEVSVVTDRSWLASYSGATKRPAAVASDRRALARRGEQFESGTGSVLARWPILAAFALLSVLLCRVSRRLWPRLASGSAEDPLRVRRVAVVLLGLVVILWGVRFANNYPWLARSMGFDAVAHHDYVAHIQTHAELPAASAGPQMHQPPLYYTLAATVAGLTGQDVAQGEGTGVLRLFSLILGLVQIGFLFASLRLFLPDRLDAQLVGLLFVAFLPMHAFVYSFVTNETLTGTLSAAVIYLLLRTCRSESSLWVHAGLGVCLGLAAITKITALVLCPVVFLALAGSGFARSRLDFQKVILPVLVTLLVFAAIAGWHYIRAWVLHGTPFVRHIDLTDQVPRWREPGYHTFESFFRFGRVLVEPYFAGFDSYPEAFYSTLWGDGRLAGGANSFVRPAWNYQLMAAGYALALLPTFLIFVGGARSIVEFLRQPRVLTFVPVALAVVMVLALLRENLAHPYITVMKSWYTLPAMTAMAYFAATGFAGLAQLGRWLRWTMIAGLGCWAMTSYVSFWIQGSSPEASMILGVDAMYKETPSAALEPLRAALRIDPEHADSHYWLGSALRDLKNHPEAYRHFDLAVRFDPEHVAGRVGLAEVSSNEAQHRTALRHLQEAFRLAPDHLDTVAYLTFLLNRFEGVPNAERVARTALHSTRNTQDHVNQAVLCMKLGDAGRSVMQCLYALEFGFYRAETIGQVGPLINKNIADVKKWQGPDRQSARAAVLAAVAWLCASNPDPRVRRIAAPLPLATEANRLTGGIDPRMLWILAAAQADAGDFSAAAESANRALDQLRRSDFPVGVEELRSLLATVSRGQAYRTPGRPLRALLSAK